MTSVTQREGLSRAKIAEAALAMTDDVGLAGLSMRKLGASLGVEAMSLYHYVQNKDDLLDAVLERLYLEIELPHDTPESDWETAIRRGLRAFHDVLIGHPAAKELFSLRPAPTLEAFEVLTWSHGRFAAVGLDLAEANQALHFAVSFVMGFAATEMGSMAVVRSGAGLDPDNAPTAQQADALRMMQDATTEEMFESGLAAVVAGLRSLYNLP